MADPGVARALELHEMVADLMRRHQADPSDAEVLFQMNDLRAELLALADRLEG